MTIGRARNEGAVETRGRRNRPLLSAFTGPRGFGWRAMGNIGQARQDQLVELRQKRAEYLQREKDARTQATSLADPISRAEMQRIADTWRELADAAAKLIGDLQH